MQLSLFPEMDPVAEDDLLEEDSIYMEEARQMWTSVENLLRYRKTLQQDLLNAISQKDLEAKRQIASTLHLIKARLNEMLH